MVNVSASGLWKRSDLPLFVMWLNDPDVRQGILLRNPVSQAEEDNWYERMLTRPADEHVLGIEVRKWIRDEAVKKVGS